MTTEAFPVDQLAAGARDRAELAGPGRVIATIVGAVFAALGWAAGRGLVVLGWVAGHTWLVLAYMAEAVVFGFRNGAGLPPRDRPEQPRQAR
jgi:hypothetical protein